MKKIILCNWCIQGNRSHGELIFVGDPIDPEEYTKCEMCGEDSVDEELFECVID